MGTSLVLCSNLYKESCMFISSCAGAVEFLHILCWDRELQAPSLLVTESIKPVA
jgi:hypothetical protein